MNLRVKSTLIGTALGDSLGLPYEGLSAFRAPKLLPGPVRQRMWLGKGLISDDTIQSIFVAQSLNESGGDIAQFQKSLGRRLRTWFLSCPPGIGLNTVKACSRLTAGISPTRSGLPSAGNGAAMRSAVIGAWFPNSREDRRKFAVAGATVTHTHPLAIMGAEIIAELAAGATLSDIKSEFHDWPFDEPLPSKGPTGYVVHSVNAVITTVFCADSVMEGIEHSVRLGGDTDTVAAMTGGVLAARGQILPNPLPAWVGWPQPEHMNGSLRVPYLRLLGQHGLGLPLILAFGFRRLLPPF